MLNTLRFSLQNAVYFIMLPFFVFCIIHIFIYRISAGERPQAARLLRSWVRIPPGEWIFVYCECRVLSGRGLCDELITRPEESYRLCCVVVCDLETSRMGAPYIYIYDISRLRVNNLTLILLRENGELLIMPANSRWDLNRRLKG